jgi:2-keto-4-pentenoate hydratase/2-oxohepta-3-ene-1,7-dioic acid hydratase in catechol pathway
VKIIRFETQDGHICTGRFIDPACAEILDGTIADGFFPTGKMTGIARLLAPVDPPDIFAIGFNYLEHAKETASAPPEHPVLFMKATSSLNHPFAAIVLPACETRGPETDFEGELAVVIGRTAKNVREEDALSYVAGYTCANDVSARRWQKHAGGGQWIRGKSFDTFCPLGPWMVTADEIDNPQALQLTTRLNGEQMQHSCTSSMIFSVAALIAYISTDTTLRPGTVILTGTPEGVGFTREPRVFLKPGDEVCVTIDRIGTLRNAVRAAPRDA